MTFTNLPARLGSFETRGKSVTPEEYLAKFRNETLTLEDELEALDSDWCLPYQAEDEESEGVNR